MKSHKARLVIRGDLQEGELDTFAAVVDFITMRVFLAFACINNWVTVAIDFVNAFCQTHYPDILDPIWVYPPRGFYHQLRGTHLLKLTKSMYGLRDAPRLWNDNLFKYLKSPELGFTQATTDKCLLV